MSGINKNILGSVNTFTDIQTFRTGNDIGLTLENVGGTANIGLLTQTDDEFCIVAYSNKVFGSPQILAKTKRNTGLIVGTPAGGCPYGEVNAKGYKIEGRNVYPCQAWARVNVNASGVPSIVSDEGFSSVTDVGVGLFTLNFDTAQANANYAIAGAVEAKTASFNPGTLGYSESASPSTTALPLAVSTNNGLRDPDFFSVAVFGKFL